MWDTRFDERDVKEIRTKTTTYLGVGAIAKIDDIAADLKARGIDSILCVTGGHSYKLTGAWDYVTAACAKHGIRISLYDKVTPNPTTDSIDEAAALGRSADAKAVLCIGGGICNEGETLLAPVREYVDREQYGGAKVRTKICKAQLGNDAGIIGAALLGK